MSFLNAVFIYVLIWWVTLFTVLPLGVERHTEKGKGYDAGAPKHHNLKKKLVLNSAIAAVILGIIEILVLLEVIQWDKWFR